MRRTLVGINVWNQFEEAVTAYRSFRESLGGNEVAAEFLVVDDASDERRIRDYFEPLAQEQAVHYVRNPVNLRLTRSWNVLLRYAVTRGFDYVIQSNSDVFFPEEWLGRFVRHLEKGCEYLLPLTNNPGRYSTPVKHHPQDIRNLLPDFVESRDPKQLGSEVMERIRGYQEPAPLASGNGFFIGFRTDFLRRIDLGGGEFWSEAPKHLEANQGVGGDESEIRKRTGSLPWLAMDVYIHHFRPANQLGRSRQAFLTRWLRRIECA